MTNSAPTLALLIPQYVEYLRYLGSAHIIERENQESLNASGLTWGDLEQAAASAEQVGQAPG
jgi:hypothetical protein